MSALLGCLGILTLSGVLITVGTSMRAWALLTLWGWFVVPTFHVAPLPFWMAAGLCLVFSAIRGWDEVKDSKDEPAERLTNALVGVVAYNLCLMGAGYVVHLLAVRP